MQTFLPYPDFYLSARVLDRQRLGKQRVEAKQIYLSLVDPTHGWQNHPAVKMWREHLSALASYGHCVCSEWKRRGYKDTLDEWFVQRLDKVVLPRWIEDDGFHLSHQSNLVRKNAEYYRQHFPSVPDNLPYIWPKA